MYRGCFLAFLLAWLLLSPLPAGARAEIRHVLVLSSSERPFAPQSGFVDGLIRELIQSSREPIQFVEVSIQAVRASSEAPGVAIAKRIRAAFGDEKLDLVMTIGGPAATFAQQFRAELFPTTPTLIAGVDRRFVENGTFTDNETTVALQHDPAGMIDEILRLLPETRSVMVVVGTSLVEQFWLREMQRDFGRFGDRLHFTWTNTLSFSQIVERSRTMPDHSAIFFAILAVDGKGEPRTESDTIKALDAAANAPLFGLHHIGSGIVGGPLLSTEALSRTTAAVALRVLAGESPGSIKTPVQRTGQPTYDARELKRWNIDEALLPPGSLVLFREPTTWRTQRPITLIALGAIPAAALLLAVMKRRRDDSRKAAATAALMSTSGDATVRVWTAGADGERVEAGRVPGAGHDSWTTVVHPDDVERCREIYRRAFERREPFQMEYRIRCADGAERWILDTGTVKFSGAAFDGYVGTAVDITRLWRARAELSNLSRHLIETHEQQGAALAITLHEDVCQRMVALTLRLQALQGAAQEAAVSEVADIRAKLAGLVAEIASVSDPVYERLALLGLAVAGRRFCDDLAARHDVAIDFQDEAVPRDLPYDSALALLRVLQEATINAVVHSKAQEVKVLVRGTAAEVRLQVVDRGIGFDPQQAAPGGVGLVAIRERLKLVKGDSVIVSAPGEGTRVEAWVPLPL